jgi:DNA polymerase-3 subunit beta
MRFSAQAGALAMAVKTAMHAVHKSSKVPILTHMKIAAGADGTVTAAGTDLDLSITASADADVTEPGAVVLPAERLKVLLSEIPEDAAVAIANSDGGATVQCGRSRYKFPTLPVDDFPSALKLNSGATEWSLGTDILKTVQAAESDETTRFHLCGVHIHAVDGKLAVVAADGFALIVVATDITLSAPWAEAGIIIPSATIEAIIKAGGNGEVRFRSDGRRVEAVAGDVTITSRLIDGTFPDYSRIIPTPSENRATVDGELLAAALRRAGVVANSWGTVGIAWDAGTAQNVIVRVACNERGESEDVIHAGADTTGSAKVSISATRMLAILDAVDADAISLDYQPNASAILITILARPSVTAALAVCRY